MAEHKADIVIFGAGIAGLWTFRRLKMLGYDTLLLEAEGIGGGQTLASQGIIHSGLKYALGGKINKLAKSISTMPDLWRAALRGEGEVDLSAAGNAAIASQHMLIPPGTMGGFLTLVTKKILGGNVKEIAASDWPENINKTGFCGTVIHMDEPVLDIGLVLRALAEPERNSIRRIASPDDPLDFLEEHEITARRLIFTGAGSNHKIAKRLCHDSGLETQRRPLLMGMMRPAPYPLYAHLVGPSSKPLATITTHKMRNGMLVWYLGGALAEAKKEADPEAVIAAVEKAFSKFLPNIDLSIMEWATLPIDRVEGKSERDDWMPDTPTIHGAENALYGWPTKLTFAPLLANRILKRLEADGIRPSGTATDWSFLPEAPYSEAPWNKATWTKEGQPE